eukprot:scaffold9674_cov74-Cyclotella_meneghiniana.AAC.5
MGGGVAVLFIDGRWRWRLRCFGAVWPSAVRRRRVVAVSWLGVGCRRKKTSSSFHSHPVKFEVEFLFNHASRIF